MITDVRFTRAPDIIARTGLIGWATLLIDGLLVVDGVALRRTRDGSLTLSFPAPRDRRGRRQEVVRPVDDAARRKIEAHVFAALGRDQAAIAGVDPDRGGRT